MDNFYNKSIDEVFKTLESSANGLDNLEAAERFNKYGPNQITEKKKSSEWLLFLSQFKSILIIILIIAGFVSFFINDILEAAVIFIIVFINAIIGYIQERKAERALEALKKISAPNALVLRETKMIKIPAGELVPGDIIILNVGDKVPADCRVLEEMNLKIDESILTGESYSVSKGTAAIDKAVHLSEQTNMLFSGTTVVYGHCKAVVTSTGMNTEFGKIASGLVVREEKTPLQKNLADLGRQLGIIIVLVSVLVFALGTYEGGSLNAMFMTAVALAVAAIPEGLPAVVTITLAIGLQRMVKRNAIMRKLPAVETLGCTTIICSDKTGTLTMNEMTVRKVYVNRDAMDVTGEGYEIKGAFLKEGTAVNPDENLRLLLKIGVMCNDASVEDKIGDPTELALLVSAGKASVTDERKEKKRIAENPFDSERKMMSVVYSSDNKNILYSKGAVEEVLKKCNSIYENGNVREMTIDDRERILGFNHAFASEALRILAFAFREADEIPLEKNLVFVGLQGMIDPPRSEVFDAIEQCKKAGIKVVMITGDHKDTAMAVAKELKIIGDNDEKLVLTGNDLDAMVKEEFEAMVEGIRVYARVSPEHKVKITDALRKRGHVIAMTGDGVNDAPALKKADIGVAMGITGTDVSKEASDMILTDDNFSSIVSAVEEGRRIYDNIRKFVRYLLACNLGEVMVVAAAMLFSTIITGNNHAEFILILLPLQILWMNLLTDLFPALALGLEPKEPDIMNRRPRNANERIVTRSSIAFILFVAILMSIGTLFLFYDSIARGLAIERARTIAFTTIVIMQLFVVMSIRSDKPIIKIGLFSNSKLVLAVILSFLLQLAVVYLPFLNVAFGTVPLYDLTDWAKVFGVCFAVFLILEGKKLISRHNQITL